MCSRPSDPAIVFDTDQEPSGLVAHAIREADGCFDQVSVAQCSSRLRLELDIQLLACGSNPAQRVHIPGRGVFLRFRPSFQAVDDLQAERPALVRPEE